MARQKNSPGPWVWDEDFTNLWAGKKVVIDDGSAAGEYQPTIDPYHSEEDRANAYLIAAAPDLLLAIEGILEAGIWLPDRLADAVDEAIKKAYGAKK